MNFAHAIRVADAVLYEGYLLYPYRASAAKNRMRWQFGVLAPRTWSEAGGCEHWWMQTECLVEAAGAFQLTGKLRFLQVYPRRVEALDSQGLYRPVEALELETDLWTSWDEALVREVEFAHVIAPGGGTREVGFEIASEREVESIALGSGRLIRERAPLLGLIRLQANEWNPPGNAQRFIKLRVRVDNLTPWADPGAPREAVMHAAFASAHTLLAVEGASFVSMLAPPPPVQAAASACDNVRTWPVLAGAEGERDLILSSPIILYDYPRIAPESPGDWFDATEIDELLTLRTMTLTSEEKRQARASDPRAAALVDRADTMPPEVLDRLHGAIRYLGANTTAQTAPDNPPWWDPAADASVAPETDSVQIGTRAVSKGSRVRLHPGHRRADAQDMFLAGRIARVEGVFCDLENRNYVAVTLEDDPAAFGNWRQRFLYFYPDEVEPLEVSR